MTTLPTGHVQHVNFAIMKAAYNDPLLLKGLMFHMYITGQNPERLQRIAYIRFGIDAELYRNTLWDLGILPCYGSH